MYLPITCWKQISIIKINFYMPKQYLIFNFKYFFSHLKSFLIHIKRVIQVSFQIYSCWIIVSPVMSNLRSGSQSLLTSNGLSLSLKVDVLAYSNIHPRGRSLF